MLLKVVIERVETGRSEDARLAERAAERSRAPSVLSWTTPPVDGAVEDDDAGAPDEGDAPDDDGVGAFIVTVAGHAALQPAA